MVNLLVLSKLQQFVFCQAYTFEECIRNPKNFNFYKMAITTAMVGEMSGRSNLSDRSYKSRRLSKFVALKKLEMCKRQNSDCSKQPQVASLSCLACTFQFLATICVAAKRISFATFLWQDKEKLRKKTYWVEETSLCWIYTVINQFTGQY